MTKIADISEPANELERLIADLSESGPLIFVFGDGWCTAHLTGTTAPAFRGPADRRWWHVELGEDAAKWIMDVRIDEITGVRFVREPYPFSGFPGQEVLTVQFLGPGGDTVLYCFVASCMTASGCTRRSLRPGKHCANATATATSRESIEAPSWLRPPERCDHRHATPAPQIHRPDR
jgi:hypothetical protein